MRRGFVRLVLCTMVVAGASATAACGSGGSGTTGAVDRSLVELPDKADYARLLEAAADRDSPVGTVVFRLAEATGARIVDGSLRASGPTWQPALDEVDATLAAAGLVGLERELADESVAAIEAEREQLIREARVDVGDLNLYFVAGAPEGVDRIAAARALNALDVVDIAYAMVLLEPAQVRCAVRGTCGPPQSCADPRDCAYEQRVLAPEPAGLGIEAERMWCIPGARGDGVHVFDLEQGWNRAHAELDGVEYLGDWPATSALGGAQPDARTRGMMQHGTAVLGEIISRDDGLGTTGIVPEAHATAVDVQWTPFFSRLFGLNVRLYDFPRGLRAALRQARAGDIALIEQHMPTTVLRPCTTNRSQCGYVPMELLPEVPALIRAGVGRGVHVVEAAGNGSQDLDASGYLGRFDRRGDSGAIMVGATGPDWVTPAPWTNFGSRVDVHAFGNDVVTLGYGDLFEAPEECTPDGETAFLGANSYTSCFSGTSSASPIVTGAVGMLEGVARRLGVSLDPICLRDALVDSGLPQEAEPDRAIGPLPFPWGTLDAIAALPEPPARDGPDAPVACWEATAECLGGADCASGACQLTARGSRCASPCAGDAACGAGERCLPAHRMDGSEVVGAGGAAVRICSPAPLTPAETSCLCEQTAGLACSGGRGSPRAGRGRPVGEVPDFVVTLDDRPMSWSACERAAHPAQVQFERWVFSPEPSTGCSVVAPGRRGASCPTWIAIPAVVVVWSRRRARRRTSARRDPGR